ncbi:MAG: PEGA domain-containing protein [Paramuribaculum sp.]|nr:PEGA domain-containing protein [Paramuribaculum sp.]
MKKALLLLMLLTLSSQLSEAAKKITINTIPETASIYIDGQMVGTGSYQVKFDRNTDFYVVKIEADGYIPETYRLRKDNPKNTVLYTLQEDEAMAASVGSEDGVDLANRWFDVTCRKGLTEDQIWKRLMSVCTNYFDNIEVRDKSAGWIKTGWRITHFKKQSVRTRLEVRISFTDNDMISYRVRLTVQEKRDKTCRGENCYKSYDRVLRTFEPMIQELQTSVGGGE